MGHAPSASKACADEAKVMKPIRFPSAMDSYAVDQPEYEPLPAHRCLDVEGTVITCWRLSWAERLKVLFTGTFFISILTFNTRLQPLLPSVDQPWLGGSPPRHPNCRCVLN